MSVRWWHFLFVVAIGYLLGYYFPQLGTMTVNKVIPKTANG
jgi:hypothetical protein